MPLYSLHPPSGTQGHVLLQHLPRLPGAGLRHRHQEDGGPRVPPGILSCRVWRSYGNVSWLLIYDVLGLVGAPALLLIQFKKDIYLVLYLYART